ncbi:peptidoglycan DD-metalloendopeptidase family protein [Sporosarcina beigongshangi]|uniref:peptidoglycan DD-metalloendopeptidase family protein n=1 Tax=Sporosarcina beigongshangi TaxID=2782538 RepID=UPI0019398046|nr:M23 family metallopeptidase [Sporosarcina beigongshangi]
MLFKKNNQDKTEPTLSVTKRPFKVVSTVLISTLMLTGFGTNTGYADTGEDKGLATIFHIYSNGAYIGVLSDEEKLERLKEEELQKAASEFENLPLTIGTDLSVIPERVFTVGADDNTVLEKLQGMLSVEAEAIAITIDEELAFYVNDMAAYDEVIRKLKLQSVTEKELNEFEARTKSSESIPALQENETRIANILMSGEIRAEASKTAPSEVRNIEEAVTLLNKGTLEQKKYSVKSGDVLGTIAVAHQMTTAKLLELNPSFTVDTVLQLEDELNVTVTEPYVEVEVHYETRQQEVIPHKVVTQEDNSIFKGEKKITQEGTDGEKDVTKLIRKRNGVVIGSSVVDEQILVEAKDQVTVVGTKVMPSRGTGSFIWPTVGGYVSSQMGSRWGRTHQGIDIARPSSRTIKAADNGVVTAAGWQGAYGNRIIITHNNGYETLYAHLSSIDVSVGQTVPQGTAIGIMGSTGRSTGIHLHFEVLKNGANVNPMGVLR